MANPRISRCYFWCALQLFVFLQLHLVSQVWGNNLYKVGDLDAWNIPSSSEPDVYTKWPKYLTFNVEDSLLFLYPPSKDSVILVTAQSYNSCNRKDPILKMNDGNSLFNLTCPGEYFFTSGMNGHCEQSQKLHISVPGSGNGSCSYAASYAAGSGAGDSAQSPQADSPSSSTAFGSIIPLQETSSSPLFHPSQVFIVSAVTTLLLYVVGL